MSERCITARFVCENESKMLKLQQSELILKMM